MLSVTTTVTENVHCDRAHQEFRVRSAPMDHQVARVAPVSRAKLVQLAFLANRARQDKKAVMAIQDDQVSGEHQVTQVVMAFRVRRGLLATMESVENRA